MEFLKTLIPERTPKTAKERREARRAKRRTAVDAVIRLERRKIRRRRFRKFVWPVLRNILILLVGALAGIHRRVILALIKGKELPESPHRWCK